MFSPATWGWATLLLCASTTIAATPASPATGFQDELRAAQERAAKDPSRENIQHYAYLRRIALDVAAGDVRAADSELEAAPVAGVAASGPASKEISIGCNTVPLPTTPQGATWQAVVDESFLGRTSRFQMTAWRKPCSGSDYQLMLTLSPTAGPTTIFSPFAVDQDGRTYNVMPVISEAGTPFAGNLAATTTVMLQYVGARAEAYDDERALTIKLLSFGGPTVSLNVPAASDTTPSPFALDGRVRGSYYDPTMSGQGLLFDVVEGSSPVLFGGWYTASPNAATPDQHEWFTLIGPIAGDHATVDVYLTTRQRFVQPTPVATSKVGTAIVTFTSCTHGTLAFNLPAYGKSGTVPLERLTPPPQGCN